jgi:molecular chaperone GrpE (heat shock protein)
MQTQMRPRVPKWPFFVGDLLLLGAAYFIYLQSRYPMGAWQLSFIVLCAGGGAMLCIAPFLLEYRLLLKLAESETLTSATAQLKNLEQIAAQIGTATGQWFNVQESADKTATQAQQISERMSSEVKAFTEFLQRANDNEKATLKLEVEKLRRGEGEWLQVVVRILDHVYALHAGAVRSGQPRVIEQITNFQAACQDAARRIGVAPFIAGPGEAFNAQRHESAEADARPSADATITETVAAGYSYQGRLIRPALVRSGQQSQTAGGKEPKPEPDNTQSQLPLETAAAS